jgi:uncharacterized protein (UPF0264 family)
MTKLLVSVRSVEEALLVATGGADFIDLKEPAQGALGGLPEATVRAIVHALRGSGCTLPIRWIGSVSARGCSSNASRD